jgi:hypothetical protein
MTAVAAAKKRQKFDSHTFLSTIDGGRTIAEFAKKQTIFIQGDSADAVFYIQTGKVKLTVLSQTGKEATIGILNEGGFFGEGCLAGQFLRMCSATAVTDCTVMRIEKKAHDGSDSPRACIFRHVRGVFADTEYPIRRGLGRPPFQFKREATGSHSSPAGSFRQRGKARGCDSQDQSGNSSRDGGHNSRASQFLHEQVQEVGLRSLQR